MLTRGSRADCSWAPPALAWAQTPTGPEDATPFLKEGPALGTAQSSVHNHSRPSKRRLYPPFAEETEVHSGPMIAKTYRGIIRSQVLVGSDAAFQACGSIPVPKACGSPSREKDASQLTQICYGCCRVHLSVYTNFSEILEPPVQPPISKERGEIRRPEQLLAAG
ncbi:hypothetical protein MG293_007357 [Ovis ammon polii]|uniref:Uncharacterized protein n=1 Tax=Ovis ammon polii TaxID=230172 RepID=A0AAD4YBN3_OVIAM|nr:hypothetical protein MG293_007357 [Ovis ammon polii]KAI4573309.1 hypothetical protein MJT46_004549 [Ovis ammon polii x Ovis aries]